MKGRHTTEISAEELLTFLVTRRKNTVMKQSEIAG